MSCCCDGPEVFGYRLDEADEFGEAVPDCCGGEMDVTAAVGDTITYTCGCGIVLETDGELVGHIIYPASTGA